MATIRVHEDQENRLPEGRSKQSTMAVQQKRVVLGLMEKNRHHKEVQVQKDKQPLSSISDENINKENRNSQKENRKNIVNPIVPVAQFEAFKVYEDVSYEDRMAKIEEKLKAKSKSMVYKGTMEDRFYTKKEIVEMERKGLIPPAELPEDEEEVLSLMNIERSVEAAREQIKSDNDFFIIEEYSLEIYQYLREHELLNRPKAGYMKKQPDIDGSMRAILVDWLVEVSEEYKLHTETLYLAVNYIDRFLSYMSVLRGKLQLVGTAAMFLASKYEEIYCPNIQEFVYITDDTYSKRQVIRMEHLILKVLGFDLSIPTPLAFITAMCAINKISEKVKFLAMYLCELSILDGENYLTHLPSALAASAIAIAQHTLEEKVWNEDFVHNTQYELDQLRPCIEFLYGLFRKGPTLEQHAIQDKYKSQKYLNVSQLTPKERLFFKS
ncbi:cyclin-A2 [Cylas formicarius]|uniref:cyclin-A2 n=1 Tax=Cylas formicarius TaxID=197179 RepID=UPI0029586ACA|nr:cyclin-A2 [Cylas formicarius]XP_060532143.1 cyclin-A2 [Cylas formicarius]